MNTMNTTTVLRRTVLARMTVPAVGAAALAACGIGASRDDAPAGGPIKPEAGTLQWLTWNPAANLELYKQVASGFQAQQTGIKLDLVVPASEGDYFTNLKTQLAAGQTVDIIGGSPVWVPDVASTGVAKDLSGYVSRDRGFKLDEYAKGVVDAGTWKGKLYFLTLFANFNVLFYNKALFDRAGVKYPDETWTRESALDAAKRLTQRSGDAATDVFGFNFVRDLNNTLPWIWQNGGDAFDKSEDPTKATMSSAATLDAL